MQPFSETGEGQRQLGLGAADGALCGSRAEERVCSPGQDCSPSVPWWAPWPPGLSRPGAKAQTRWTERGLWPQTERSGLLGGGPRRGGQPDVESVGRTLRSQWCLGCPGRQPRVGSTQCVGRGGPSGRGGRPRTPLQGQGPWPGRGNPRPTQAQSLQNKCN